MSGLTFDSMRLPWRLIPLLYLLATHIGIDLMITRLHYKNTHYLEYTLYNYNVYTVPSQLQCRFRGIDYTRKVRVLESYRLKHVKHRNKTVVQMFQLLIHFYVWDCVFKYMHKQLVQIVLQHPTREGERDL